MKRCPQCNRVETEDTLTFCRVDGTPLVRENGAGTEGASTLKLPAQGIAATDTRILPTGEARNRPAAPTTMLDARRAADGTRESSKPKSRRGAVIAAAIIAVALAASVYLSLTRGRSAARNSIAVLPFVNAGNDPDVEYLSDGISESLINSLSQLPNVRVMARSTMFSFKGKDADPRAVGKQLGVDAVVTGRVVQLGDGLSVQADLVNVSDGSQLWGERYNRKASDILAVQEDIVRAIVGKLRPRLSGEQQERVNKRYTENTEAYQLYLKALFYQNKRTTQDFQKAIEYFQQAIALDPNYALAYAGLADTYGLLAGYSDVSLRITTMPKAREAALKALSLDNNLAEAHTALGYSLENYEVAEREYKRALELNPNYATARHYYANLLSKSGKHEEALAESRRALEIEPLSLIINRAYGDRLFFARRYDDAIAQLKKTLELDAGFPSAHYTLALAYQMRANYAEAVEEHAQYQELIGERQKAALIRESYARDGWQGFLRTITDERLRFNLSWDNLTAYYAALGEKDKAFASLNKAYENGAMLVNLKVDPRLDSLRDESRFADLIRKRGLPQQ